MIKAGAVMAKRFTEWFDPHNPLHQLAAAYHAKYGTLPPTFVPSDVWEDDVEGPLSSVRENVWEVRRYRHVLSLVGEIGYRIDGAPFTVTPISGDYLTVSCEYYGHQGSAILLSLNADDGQVNLALRKALESAFSSYLDDRFSFVEDHQAVS